MTTQGIGGAPGRGWMVLPRAGGSWDNGADLGGACRDCNDAASTSSRDYGARISCI